MVDFKPLYIEVNNNLTRNPELTNEEFDACLLKIKDNNIEALWQSATNYQESYISGAAIGMLTVGFLQSKPKSLAVMMWIQEIWDLYYQRKATITHEWVESNYDFSSVGAIPYTVPEIKAEVLGT